MSKTRTKKPAKSKREESQSERNLFYLRLFQKQTREALGFVKSFEETTGESFPKNEAELFGLAWKLDLLGSVVSEDSDPDKVYAIVKEELRKRQEAGDNKAKPARDDGMGGRFNMAALRKMTGLGNKTINSYAKTAKVRTPGRGQRNYSWGYNDTCLILKTIIARTSEGATRDKCQLSLDGLPKTKSNRKEIA